MAAGPRLSLEDPVAFVDERTGQAPLLRKTLRYVFPEHWSFLLGELALYSFMVLVATGVYLALFFEPSLETTVYDGPYAPLRGREITAAYDSALALSFEVRAGLLMRQTHHWAANVFVVAIVVHMLRIFFTGAYRKPRELTYYAGLTLLALALLEGFLGYSLLDDLLSGMGLQIAYSVVLATPVIGGNAGLLLWGGEYPGSEEFLSRMYIAHVLLLPLALAALIGIHLALIALRKHTQFPGPGRTESNVVGLALWPAYALRSLGLLGIVAAVLLLMGGLIQINPVWLWGPFETWLSTNGAQPDWYLGWLIGALRIMPPFEPTVGDYTLVGNAFFGGALLPLLVFAFLYAWPRLERRLTGDRGFHHLLQRPREAPARSGVGAALITLVALILLAGSADRVSVQTGLSYEAQLWAYRAGVLVLPPLAFLLTSHVCHLLAREDLHPVRPELFEDD